MEAIVSNKTITAMEQRRNARPPHTAFSKFIKEQLSPGGWYRRSLKQIQRRIFKARQLITSRNSSEAVTLQVLCAQSVFGWIELLFLMINHEEDRVAKSWYYLWRQWRGEGSDGYSQKPGTEGDVKSRDGIRLKIWICFQNLSVSKSSVWSFPQRHGQCTKSVLSILRQMRHIQQRWQLEFMENLL